MPNRAMSGQMPEVLSLQQMPWVTVRCVKLRTDERRVSVSLSVDSWRRDRIDVIT
jgi:hypothetical protein